MRNKILTTLVISLLLISFLITGIPSGMAADKTVTVPDASNYNKEKEAMSDPEKKLSTSILQLSNSKYLPSDMTTNDIIVGMKHLGQIAEVPITNGQNDNSSGFEVYVYIKSDQGTNSDILTPHVSRIVNQDMDYGLVTAWVDINSLIELASVDEVKSIREVIPPVTRSGAVTSQGDYVHYTDLVRSEMGADGSGIKVGIVSDGVDSLSSAVASGDLPGDVTVLSNVRGGDEGTAMLEIVHDLAPGAQLYFHDCGTSELEFNDAITALKNAGCDVICDDIGWLLEPFFEDGVVAQHIDDLLDTTDIIYTSSAGNNANEHFQGQFYDSGNDVLIGGYYYPTADFSGGTNPSKPYLYATVPHGGALTVIMQWDDWFGASSNDYDLFVVDRDTKAVLSSSQYTQNGNDDPLEYLYYPNSTGSELDVEIIALAYNAPVDKTLEILVNPSGGASLDATNVVKADSIFGHPAVPEVLSCAAVPQYAPDTIEDFSCLGPVTHITETRQKPDIAGADGVHVTGAGGFGQYISGNYYFFGTSASSPHIAAIAAVLQSRFPSKPPSEIRQLILDSAVDLGDSGYDNVFGYGRSDAMGGALAYVYVTFDSKDGSAVDTQLISNGGKASEPEDPTRTGFLFEGWYKDEGYTEKWDFANDTVTLDTTLFAKWGTFSAHSITSDGTYDMGAYGNNFDISIADGLTVTLTNTTGKEYTNTQIVCGTGVSLTIDRVTINNAQNDDKCPLSFTGSNNHLSLTNYSSLTGGDNQPGIRVEEGTSLEISGTGNVSAYNGADAAGIGGSNASACGEIMISSGEVTGYSGGDGAGIGGGANGDGGTITVTGGKVNGYSYMGAGIGGGANGDGGTITIAGGEVYAPSTYGAGIGGGSSGAGGTISITGGTVLASSSDAHDIGYGNGGSGGSLAISGDAEVLLQFGTSIVPTTSHELVSTNIVTDNIVFGKIELQGGWDPPIYAYLDTDQLYELTYDGNAGMSTQTAPYFKDTTAALLSNVTSGDTVLVGWNTQADGMGTAYAPGSNITMTSDITLYAMWGDVFEGSGSEAAPYLIETAQDLCVAAQLINAGEEAYSDNKCYLQTANIDLSVYEIWTPIGWDETFVGTYDGDGYTISNINIEFLDAYYPKAGLFGDVEGTIKNVNMAGGNIHVTGTMSIYVGSIAGYLENSTLQNCSSSASITASGNSGNGSGVGGIAGWAYQDVTISDCNYSGNIASGGDSSRTGGIVGYMSYAVHINNCENSGDIQVQEETGIAGGIAGYSYISSTELHSISSSRNTGDINVLNSTSLLKIGGIIGEATYVDITDCENLGKITIVSPDDICFEGGIAGYSRSVSITDCANRADIIIENASSLVYSGGIVGGVLSGDAQIAISQSYNTGDISIISPTSWVCSGGIAGDNSTGSISECYNTGNLRVETPGSDSYIGGILGRGTGTSYTMSITDCFNAGNLSSQNNGSAKVGGIIGYGTSTNKTYANCYNVGQINADTCYGGIAGDVSGTNDTVFSNCYYADTCNTGIGSEVGSVTSKTLTELKQQATFSGFGFADTWEIVEGFRYPILQDVPYIYTSGISIDEILGLDVGTSQVLMPVISPANASNKNVTWSSSNETVATISADGNVTLLSDGTAIITITTVDGEFTDTCEVKTRVPVTDVALSDSSLTLTHHDSQTLTSTVLPNDATYPEVTWESSDNTVATVDQNGLVEAVGVGSATITATAEEISDTCDVTVEPKNVTSVMLNHDSLTVTHWDTFTLTATVLPDDATYPEVTWESSDETVATVSDIGLVEAVGVGSATITATADGQSDNCDVTVDAKLVTGVSLNKSTITVGLSSTGTLTATVSPSNATNLNITWSSDDESVATVVDGVVTGVSVGTATITVETVDGNYTDTCVVTVAKLVTGVSLNKSSTTIEAAETETLVATVSPADATFQNVTWSSNNENVATVTDGVVRGISEGIATITVVTVDGGYTDTCTVTVEESTYSDEIISGKLYRTYFNDDNSANKSVIFYGTTASSVIYKITYYTDGNQTSYKQYDTSGRLSKVVYFYLNGNQKRREIYNTDTGVWYSISEYYSNGELSKKKYLYDNGKLRLCEFYSSSTGNKYAISEYNTEGKLIKKKYLYSNGKQKKCYFYNAESGKITAVSEYDTSGQILKKTYYRTTGACKRIKIEYYSSSTGNHFATSYYDSNGRLLRKVYLYSSGVRKYTHYYNAETGKKGATSYYDTDGDITKKTYFYDSGVRKQIDYYSSTTGNKYATSYYDENGDITHKVYFNSDGSVKETIYY